tara:strand:+ start:76 stop:486 length:411 start_codon:yes stop_codon:yes gene_type:complete
MNIFKPYDLKEGLNGLLGFRLTEWSKGFAQIEVDLDERHKNRQGGLHGGVIATLVDATTGFCGVFENDPNKIRGNVTVSLTTNFVAQAKTKTIICTATLTRAGRRLYFASAKVKDSNDNIVATAEAVYAYIDHNEQ